MVLGAWAAEGGARAGASRGARQGAREAVWSPHTTSGQHRLAPRIAPALRVGPASAEFGHQERVGRLYELLRQWACARDPRPDVCLSALDVRFAPGRILQPDVFVYMQPMARPVRMPLTAIPDLCVEVVSSDRVYDRVTKRQVYAEAGVREYWTVVPRLGFVERWTGPGLATREELRDALVTPLLPGFRLDITGLQKEP